MNWSSAEVFIALQSASRATETAPGAPNSAEADPWASETENEPLLWMGDDA